MRARISALFFLLLFMFFGLLSQQQVKAQYVAISSSLSYNSSNNQVTGLSQTSMDYYTSIYYQAYVEGYLYRQDNGALVSSGSNVNAIGGNTVAAVTTQTAGQPSTNYKLISRHVLGMLYQDGCGGSACCYYRDVYGYKYHSNPNNNWGPTNTFYPTGAVCIGSGNPQGPYIYLGNTNNNSLTTPSPTVNITNARVGGNLQYTTQSALLGAEITLQANSNYNNIGGAYGWTFTGPHTVTGGAVNSSTVKIRSTSLGSVTANVTYSYSSGSITAPLFINVVLPTVSSYTATQGADFVGARSFCSHPFYAYRLGCRPPDLIGIEFTATANAPSTFISDPAQSGIKYVQAVSSVRKRLFTGNIQCRTQRSSESDIASGWQLDGSDPYNQSNPPRFFSEGNSLTLPTVDYPSNALEDNFILYEALHVDDRFEMYLYYFAGTDPANPIQQKPIGRLAWNWGGQVVYDSNYTPPFNRTFSNAPPQNRTGMAMGANDSTVPFQGRGRPQDLQWAQCPGGPPPIVNPIDSTRYFVRRQYLDILHREPEEGGWDAWTSVMTRCGFDQSCIVNRRIITARGFLESPENTAGNPLLANPGSPEYNREYVRLCYTSFLLREPEQGGWDAWTNYLNNHPGDYNTIVHGMIYSAEYRARFGPP